MTDFEEDMDPSEFEGTLEVDQDALSAGGLETLLRAPEFMLLDLGREIDSIHLNVYNLTESLGAWNRINFGALLQSWDEQAVKITENKNELTVGRKALALKVKAFTTAYLGAGATSGEADAGSAPWKQECEQLVSAFKAHVDTLSSSSRFAETAFLSTYKLMTSAEDPSLIIEKCLQTLIMAQEALKAAQENMIIADQTITHQKHQNNGNSASSGATGNVGISFSLLDRERLEKQEKQHQREREELEARHSSELALMRERFDVELRDREQLVRSDLDRAQMEFQQNFESLLERKEAQVTSLLSTVNDSSQRAIEAEERGISLQHEVTKRRELEERLRTALCEVADTRTLARETQTKFEDAFAREKALETTLERDSRQAAHDIDNLSKERTALREALQKLEGELALRPPVDFSDLAQALGIDLADLAESSGAGNGRLVWRDLEAILKESLRRSHSAAAEARAAEQEATSRRSSLVAELSRLGAALESKETEVAVLERDLMAAHRLIESNKALLRCLPSEQDHSQSPGKDEERRPSAGRLQTPVKAPPSPVSQSGTQYQARCSPSSSSSSSAALADLERGAGGAGTAALLGEASASSSDRMMQAILSQRDRFMKLARERETELAALRGRLDKMQEEQLSLRQDNLELYRRQRALRGAGTAGAGLGGGTGADGLEASATPSKDRARVVRRDVRGSLGGAGPGAELDTLDAKYSKLYEDSLDPFKFEEADRAAAIGRLNWLERALANISRFLLQDRWTRHALVVYLVLVHFFALGYVQQILNPQLIDEVDYYSRAKYSQQTLDSFEIEPDW